MNSTHTVCYTGIGSEIKKYLAHFGSTIPRSYMQRTLFVLREKKNIIHKVTVREKNRAVFTGLLKFMVATKFPDFPLIKIKFP